jgi:SAM-dependent methyltransferase
VTWGEDLAGWWVEEVATDPVYRKTVLPLALGLAKAGRGERWLDLGCGEGRLMRKLAESGAIPIGCDASAVLADRAGEAGAVVVTRLPGLRWLGDGTIDGAIAVLVIEHVEDVEALFAESARVTRAGGALVVIANHPIFTSPGSAPVVDPEDGEVLWRWGPYLAAGSSEESAGGRPLTFHHRPLGSLLNAAAESGWSLAELTEIGAPPEAEVPPGQEHIPRLLGARWLRV